MNRNLIDLKGQRFGRLTVIRKDKPYIAPDGDGHQTKWVCRCDCGNEVSVVSKNLRQGSTKSCGCLRKELASQRLKKIWNNASQEESE